MPIPKMYVLVRLDLAETYRIVQGSHALARFALDHYQTFLMWENSTIVYLGVRGLKDLKDWKLKITDASKCHSTFFEPDLDHQLTAIACYDTGEIFKNLKVA
jgi:hypothetical protein